MLISTTGQPNHSTGGRSVSGSAAPANLAGEKHKEFDPPVRNTNSNTKNSFDPPAPAHLLTCLPAPAHLSAGGQPADRRGDLPVQPAASLLPRLSRPLEQPPRGLPLPALL